MSSEGARRAAERAEPGVHIAAAAAQTHAPVGLATWETKHRGKRKPFDQLTDAEVDAILADEGGA